MKSGLKANWTNAFHGLDNFCSNLCRDEKRTERYTDLDKEVRQLK